MGKRIDFIAGIDAMRGNISGKQELEYPNSGNRAYEAPNGKHFAINYKPRYIACKRASDGLAYFQVKLRSAIKNTTASRLAQAALGAAGSLSAVIMKDSYRGPIYEAEYLAQKQSGMTTAKSLRAWLVEKFRVEFLKKGANLTIVTTRGTLLQLNNPFNTVQYDPERDVTLQMHILQKFWSVLCSNPIVFTVSGMKAIAHAGDTFRDVYFSNYNNLGLNEGTVGAEAFVKLGDNWVQYEDSSEVFAYATSGMTIDSTMNYVITSVTPS